MAKKQRSHGQGSLFKRAGDEIWIASWYDHTGKRLERSTRTTDRRVAERIVGKLVGDVALRRDGVVDATKDRFAVEGRKALAAHIADYIGHCRHAGQDEAAVDEKESHLLDLLKDTGATRLSDLTADTLERYLRRIRVEGRPQGQARIGRKAKSLSACTVNHARKHAVTFMSWCVDTGRAESNPLKVVPKLDERKDRRRVRRPLTDDELIRLLDVAEANGRKAWYMTAALAGLRRGDLQRLTWADVDFNAGTITITDGKASRDDVIPIHPQLADELKRRRDEALAMPTAKVFPQAVTNITTQKDFLRAGLAHRETVTDASGDPVMIGKGKRRRPKTRIVVEDDEGRVIDLHALRTTLGTNLARAGVAPQLAQRIMRHADYRTTLKHYTVLGLNDTAKAIGQIGPIQPTEREAATGTYDADNCAPQLSPQLGRNSQRSGAKRRDDEDGRRGKPGDRKSLSDKAPSDEMRSSANQCVKAGDRIRTDDVQLGKLAFYH